jgi:hypothetical protein
VTLRRFVWPWAQYKLEGAGPIIDEAVIIPNTSLDEVRAFVDTPAKVAAWFGATFDADHGTLTIAGAADALTVAWIYTELIDRGRCLTLTGVIGPGPVRSYLSLRSVASHPTDSDPHVTAVGFGTEIWTHVDLPRRTPPAVVSLVHEVSRFGVVVGEAVQEPARSPA